LKLQGRLKKKSDKSIQRTNGSNLYMEYEFHLTVGRIWTLTRMEFQKIECFSVHSWISLSHIRTQNAES